MERFEGVAYPPLPCRASPPQVGRSTRRWVSAILSVVMWQRYVLETYHSLTLTIGQRACLLPISPPEGEMPGRAEGGERHIPPSHGCGQPHTPPSCIILSLSKERWRAAPSKHPATHSASSPQPSSFEAPAGRLSFDRLRMMDEGCCRCGRIERASEHPKKFYPSKFPNRTE